MKDSFIQSWNQQCNNCNKACNYPLYKDIFCFEKYLDTLPRCYRIAMTQLRTSNHKLPVEKGRYSNLPRNLRTCTLCSSEKPGDEFHFLLECPALSELRLKYIPKYFRTNPNFYKYAQIISYQNNKQMLNLSKFIHHGLSLFK